MPPVHAQDCAGVREGFRQALSGGRPLGLRRPVQVLNMSYKAFISYSHAADGQLAPAIQSAPRSGGARHLFWRERAALIRGEPVQERVLRAAISRRASSIEEGPMRRGTPSRRKRSWSLRRERPSSSAALPRLMSVFRYLRSTWASWGIPSVGSADSVAQAATREGARHLFRWPGDAARPGGRRRARG